MDTKEQKGLNQKNNHATSHILNIFPSILRYIFLGVTESFKIIIQIIIYAFQGFYGIFIGSFLKLFSSASGAVDKTYRATKEAAVKSTKKAKENTSKFSASFQKIYEKSGFVQKQKEKLLKEREMLLQDLNTDDAKRTTKASVYRWKAKKNNKMYQGTFTGFSKLDVNSYLINEGYEVYSIETNKWINFIYGQSSIIAQKMSNKDLIFWLTQLSTYIKSGIPLTDSVRILANQMGKEGNRKRAFESIVYELTMGETFSRALEKQGTIFPTLLINMLKAAEATGELEETLDDMANYYSEIESTRKQMISAMTYPAIILLFSFIVISFIMIYVIPQFIAIYEQSSIEISGVTLAVIHISDFFRNNILTLILFIVIFVVALSILYKQVKAFRKTIQIFLMHMPVIGKIIIYNELTIFTKTFASLLKNNVFITESIDILSKITDNEVYKEIMFDTINNIAKGEKISKSFENHWAIPDVAYYMIVTGESTGELASMMQRVSIYYQEQHRNIITSLKAIIEPILIIFLAVVVGIVILAVIIPMFQMYETIG